MDECCQKYALLQKFFHIKVVKDSMSYKEVSMRIPLPPHPSGAKGSKD